MWSFLESKIKQSRNAAVTIVSQPSQDCRCDNHLVSLLLTDSNFIYYLVKKDISLPMNQCHLWPSIQNDMVHYSPTKGIVIQKDLMFLCLFSCTRQQ